MDKNERKFDEVHLHIKRVDIIFVYYVNTLNLES